MPVLSEGCKKVLGFGFKVVWTSSLRNRLSFLGTNKNENTENFQSSYYYLKAFNLSQQIHLNET